MSSRPESAATGHRRRAPPLRGSKTTCPRLRFLTDPHPRPRPPRHPVDALPARLDADKAAHGVAAVIGTGAGAEHVLLLYDRYLEAGRHARLRPLVRSWNAHARALVRRVLLRAPLPGDDATARLVLAAADGAAVAALAEGDHPGEAVRDVVGRLLSVLATDGSG